MSNHDHLTKDVNPTEIPQQALFTKDFRRIYVPTPVTVWKYDFYSRTVTNICTCFLFDLRPFRPTTFATSSE